MTSNSVLIRPHIEESGEDIEGGDDPRGQVMAAGDDDDDDMAWLEEAQYPHSDEEDAAAYEFPELEMGFDLRMSERDGATVGGEEVPQILHVIMNREKEPEESHARCRSPRHSANNTTWRVTPFTTQVVRSACGAEG